MDYVWIKALHVAAAMVFFGGTLALCVLRRTLNGPADAAAIQRVLQWNRNIVTPAMLAVWALGLTLAGQGGWFTSTWLQAKLALVLAVTAIHGIESGRMRRMSDPEWGPGPTRWVPAGVLLSGIVIALLATAKPA
jgi:uncharacterized membrane protein